MEQITEFFNNLDVNAILTAITDLLAKINFQAILNQIMTVVAGLIG